MSKTATEHGHAIDGELVTRTYDMGKSMPTKEQVKSRSLQRTLDEGAKQHSPRYYEIFRDEWLSAFPDADSITRSNLDARIEWAKESGQ